MTFVDKTPPIRSKPTPSVTLAFLKELAGIAQHTTAAGRHLLPHNIRDLNSAEEALFVAALASLIPGVDADLQHARLNVAQQHFAAYHAVDSEKYARDLLQRITNSFESHGLQVIAENALSL